jgi:hypothetical protein
MAQTLKFGNGTWATKKDSILAYNDENENYKPLPFNYTGAGKGTRVNKEGLIEVVENDRPRIDYLDSEDGVFLLENAATNLVTYSDINTSWNLQANIINSLNTDVIAPDGTLNGWKASRNINSNGYTYMTGVGLSTNTTYTASIWLKAYDVTICDAVVFNFHPNSFTSSSTSFSFETGIASGNGKVEKYSNGWYRLSLTSISNSTIGYFDIGLQPYLNGSNNWGGQDGDTLFYAYGTQVEASSQISSYIPTQGSIQTRVAETASGSGNSEVFNDSEGVLFVDVKKHVNGGSNQTIALSDGSTNNNVYLSLSSTPNQINVEVLASGSQANLSISSINQSNQNKFAVKYKQNDFALWINGFEVDTDNSGNTPVGLNRINFDFGQGSFDFFGKTKEIGYYDTALTDLELETLTSYRSWLSMVKELNLNVIYNG